MHSTVCKRLVLTRRQKPRYLPDVKQVIECLAIAEDTVPPVDEVHTSKSVALIGYSETSPDVIL